MSKSRFDYLLEQYMSGQITEAEKKEFLLFVQLMDDESLDSKFSSYWEGYDATHVLSEIRSKEILSSLYKAPQKSNRRKLYFKVASIAAVSLVLLAIGFGSENVFFPGNRPIKIYAKMVESNQALPYDRSMTLADGSHIVLKAGSKLELGANFNQKKRLVRLVGEAYFDIAHNKNKPFIIETGKVKTTVLGTAFNIKAWPDGSQVDVSVTRGRVRVENGKRLLAVLSVNQGIQYSITRDRLIEEHPSGVEGAVKWVSNDLFFDHQTMLEIAQRLSKRYGVNIEIENREVADMVLVSSFKGTESLDDILDILCGINSNTTYSINHRNVVISSLKQPS